MGKICNEKPSAIFKIGKIREEEAHIAEHPFGQYQLTTTQMTSASINAAVIGISVEPLANINALQPASETQASVLSTSVEFPKKVVENFFNYALSFVQTLPDGQQYVPFSTLQNWYVNILRRLEQNPNYWKNI